MATAVLGVVIESCHGYSMCNRRLLRARRRFLGACLTESCCQNVKIANEENWKQARRQMDAEP